MFRYFQDVISSLSFDSGNDIEVFPNGDWKPIAIKKEKEDGPPAKVSKNMFIKTFMFYKKLPCGSYGEKFQDGSLFISVFKITIFIHFIFSEIEV